MSNHTPGPWERRKRMVPIIDQEGFTWDGDYVIWQGDVPLAEVNCCDGIGEQQAGHNASLIAAAPDLLEALQDMYEWHEIQEDPEWHGSPLEQRSSKAIAKAKGETE